MMGFPGAKPGGLGKRGGGAGLGGFGGLTGMMAVRSEPYPLAWWR